MIALAISVFFASGVTITPEVKTKFNSFRNKYHKRYGAEEAEKRLEIFADNMEKVGEWNNRNKNAGGGSHVYGVTPFSDLTAEEFAQSYLRYRPDENDADSTAATEPTDLRSAPTDVRGAGKPTRPPTNKPTTRSPTNKVPTSSPITKGPTISPTTRSPTASPTLQAAGAAGESKDWRTTGIITPVKDQGGCGACWAFAAGEAVESFAKKAGQNIPLLSIQQITSCDTTSYGCGGGWETNAFKYIRDNGGLVAASDYPYISGSSGVTGACVPQTGTKYAPLTGYVNVPQGEDALLVALRDIGPVVVCLCASNFQFYSGGVMTSGCTDVNHCVQGVGYNTASDQNYWLLRNQWGTGWGEAGYVRIQRGSNLNRIGESNSYPVLA
jgi:C1A family cysteine protease